MKLPINAPSPVRRRPARDRGFSLIEMLVVVIIITLLAALIAPQVMRYVGRSKTDVADAQMSSIATALELFYLDVGRYPEPDAEGLDALVSPPEELPAWEGPYFGNPSGLTDPWGRPYGYALSEAGDRFVLTTLGFDGEEGGEGENRDLSRS